MKDAYSFTLTPGQFANAVLYRSRRQIPRAFRYALTAASVLFFGAIAFLFIVADGRRSVPAAAVMGALSVLGATIVVAQLAALVGTRRGFRRSRHMVAPRTLHVEADGLRLTNDGSEVFLRWRALAGAEIVREMLYLDLDAVSFYPLPLSAFGSREEAEEFVQLVRQRGAAASAAAGAQLALPMEPVAAVAPAAAPKRPPATRRRAILAAAGDALRLAVFRAVPEGHPPNSWAAVFAAALVSIAVPVIAAFASIGLQGEWNWYLMSSALLHVSLLLAAAIATAYAVGRASEVPRFMLAGLLVSIAIDVVTQGIGLAAGSDTRWMRVGAQFMWLPAAWLALAVATFACRSIEPGGRRLLVVASCILLVAIPLGTVYRDRSLWDAPYRPDGDSPSTAMYGPAAEDVLYKQPGLLSQELRAVRPASEGATNVFFIGMAGFGGQDVFRREVDSVTKIFRERFGADGHTIRLINNRKTLLDVPIASKTSLRAALKRVAEVMDKDRDVLVLYMTSHGSEDHHFSLSLWPVDFHEMDPATLRSLLDESGIRNRVVIIAACYSGGFVKPLEDPNTLVITAAAGDRTSFGCSNEAEWTYFGKAYFDEALRKTHSFTEAFEMAKPRIAERERQDKFEPSLPQMAVGANIAVKLDELARQLDGRAVPDGQLRLAGGRPRVPDKYDEYIGLMFVDDYLEDLRSACNASMEMSSPAETLARQPDSFGGLDRSPRHWRKLTAAWDRYAAGVCAKAYDARTIRGIYAGKVKALIPEPDLEPAIEFLHTEPGARWIRLDREAARQESVELGRMQAEVSNTLYRKYLDEQSRIFEDFRKNGK